MILISFFVWSSSKDASSQKVLQDLDSLKQSMATYENLFQLHLLYGNGWTDIKKRIDNLKKKIGTEINEDNINTAIEQFESIRQDVEKCLSKRGEENHKIFQYLSSSLNPSPGFSMQLEGYILAISAAFTRNINPRPIEPTDRCLEDVAVYARACRAESYAKDYSQKSAQYSKQISLALRLFDRVSRSSCLDTHDSRVIYAKSFINQKKREIEGKIKKIKQNPADSKQKRDLMLTIHAEELDVLKKIDNKWFDHLDIDIKMFKTIQPFVSKNTENRKTKSEKIPVTQKSLPSRNNPDDIKDIPKSKKLKSKYPLTPHIGGKVLYPVTLDVWQSAWGDFSQIDVLIRYLNRNRIKKINLNPGLPMGPKFYAEGYKKFKPLVSKFYANGISKIGFLYAELNYPIEYFARFLRTHYQEFKIDTIVDDSEFTDIFKHRFEQNIRLVKKWGIKYSAFVTLESVGNSGVSDSTRYWVLDNVDYPILMSYFGCTLEEQINKLEKYLSYADRNGKRGQVGIAILLGSKKVGREVSCEKLLNRSQLKNFLYQLHLWAIQNHPSYGGIVLETNLKMPRFDVSWKLK
jgi:hypothetical protein